MTNKALNKLRQNHWAAHRVFLGMRKLGQVKHLIEEFEAYENILNEISNKIDLYEQGKS